MNAITIGHLMVASDRLALLVGVLVFSILTTILSRKVDGRIGTWSGWALVFGILAARLVYVLIHHDNFMAEPLRILALWDGGFFWPAGLLVALLSILVFVAGATPRFWSLGALTAAVFVAFTGIQLTSGVEAITSPTAHFETLSGNKFRLDVTDRPTVVNLWASWCPPCRREMPMMADIADSINGVRFVFANQGEDAATIRNFLDRQQIHLPLVLLDSLGELGRHYRAPGLPATLFISADGHLIDIHLGEISRELFEEKITALGRK